MWGRFAIFKFASIWQQYLSTLMSKYSSPLFFMGFNLLIREVLLTFLIACLARLTAFDILFSASSVLKLVVLQFLSLLHHRECVLVIFIGKPDTCQLWLRILCRRLVSVCLWRFFRSYCRLKMRRTADIRRRFHTSADPFLSLINFSLECFHEYLKLIVFLGFLLDGVQIHLVATLLDTRFV